MRERWKVFWSRQPQVFFTSAGDYGVVGVNSGSWYAVRGDDFRAGINLDALLDSLRPPKTPFEVMYG